jgi:hypothetical protein
VRPDAGEHLVRDGDPARRGVGEGEDGGLHRRPHRLGGGVGTAEHLQLRLGQPGAAGDRLVRDPLEVGLVEHRHPQHDQLTQVRGQRGGPAQRAEQRVPALGDRRAVQQQAVQRGQLTTAAGAQQLSGRALVGRLGDPGSAHRAEKTPAG